MSRTMGSRGSRAIATAVVFAVTALPAVVPPTAVADGNSPVESVLSPGSRYVPRTETLVTAGPTGYLHQQEGTSGYLWTDYGTGTTTPSLSSVVNGARFNSGLYALPPTAGHGVLVHDLATGTDTAAIPLPEGQKWSGAFGESTAVTYETSASGAVTGLHLLRRSEDGVTDVPLPAEGLLQGTAPSVVGVAAQDRQGAVLTLAGGSYGVRLVLVDFAAGTAREVFASLGVGANDVALSGDKVLGRPTGRLTAYTVPRAEPTAAPTQTAIPALTGVTTQPPVTLALAGDWILVARSESRPAEEPGEELSAVRIGGGASRTLLKYAVNRFAAAPDGGVLVAGGGGSADWAVRRITASAAEVPVVTTIAPVAPVPAVVDGLALGGGRLSVASVADSSIRTLYDYDLALTGAPEPGPRTRRSVLHTWYQPCQSGSDCIELHAQGNGRTSYSSGGFVESPIDSTSREVVSLPHANNRVIDSSGRYTVINDGSAATQYVGDFGDHTETNVINTRTKTAASVWGVNLWKPGRTAGSVNSYDLTTKKTSADIPIASGCTPQELQVVGRWLYWSCGPTAKAGVWDLTAKKNIAVPSGEALLGDGFLVRHDRAAGRLLLTDFHKGAGTTAVTSVFADLPVGPLASDRGITWTVDRFGGDVAYVDAGQRVHVARVAVPRSPVTVLDSRVDDYTNLNYPSETQNVWHGSWLLSRPPVAWTLAFRSAAGKTVRTIRGTAHQGAQVTTTWNAKDDRGQVAPGGRYTWTLAADPGDGSGSRTVRTGTTQLAGGKSAWRDFDGDGVGELVALSNSGLLRYDTFGTSGGDLWTTSSRGWDTGYRFVPFGDLDGDGCADTLVRNNAGQLFRFSAKCAGAIDKTSPKLLLGSGFNAYNVLTSPGDVTGDGRADLLARKTSTSDVYLFAATSAGKLAAGKKVFNHWSGQKKILGAGDLNGDGSGDLLIQDGSNEVWRYNGDGKGGFKARVLVFRDWGADYNAVIGIGDLNGDGRMDLLSRDTGNRMWLNRGDGKGSFGARTRVWDGYSGYRALS
ncbi:FG-GAP-like repeat-containing protein [Streptomyces sp. NPDC058864]